MVRIRHGWLVAALALGFVAGGCKKDGDKKEGSDKVAEKDDKAGGQTSGPKSANATADDLSLLPVDSEAVMGLNFAQLQQSQLWKKFVEPKLMEGDAQNKLAEFKDKCGFDPLQAVKSVSVGIKGLGGAQQDGVIVVHGTEKSKVMTCLDKMKDEAAKDGSTIEKDGDVVLIKDKHGENMAFTYVNDDTLVAVIGTNGNAAGVKAAAAGNSALKTSPAFVDMYSKINTGDSMWMLMNGNSPAFDKAAALGFKPKAVFGSVNVTDGLTADLRVRLDTPDQATQIANMAKQQTAGFVKMVDKLDISAEQADVKFSVAISTQKLEALIQNLAGLMMGGMGGPPPGGSMGGGQPAGTP